MLAEGKGETGMPVGSKEEVSLIASVSRRAPTSHGLVESTGER